ncbi:MAG: response regulator, partial [Terriglobus roseus]|nr:response regulator [Terriglobus roseus]
FEPFVQGDLGLSKKYGGTGLGLSICSQLASLMKGSITVASEAGHGSTFVMQIPLRQIASYPASKSSSNADPGSERGSVDQDRKASEATSVTVAVMPPPSTTSAMAHEPSGDSQPRLVGLSQPFFAAQSLDTPESQLAVVERAAAEASERGDKVRVLVAEDNKTNQEVVLRMLKLEDIFDVTVAQGEFNQAHSFGSLANTFTDGQEALDRVKESMSSAKPYNLIFMDVQMPNLNGLESTRLIRQSGYTAPIVALSAYSEDTNIKECLESGMNDFISKPIRRPRLKQVLKTFCSPIPEEGEERESPGENGAPGSPKKELKAVNGVASGKANRRSHSPQVSPTRKPPVSAPTPSPSDPNRKVNDPGGGEKETE